MSRLIDADEFEVVGTKIPDGMNAESYMAGMDFVLNKIDDAPTIEPERKKGKWHTRIYSKVEMMVCSECQSEFSYDAETGVSDYNFCPNCGADMRGDRK